MKQTRLQAMWVLLFIFTLAIAFWGWMQILNPAHQASLACEITKFTKTSEPLTRAADSAFFAIKAFFFSETYENSAAFCHDWRLQIARWTGLLVALGALIQAGITVCFRPLARWRARRRRKHVIVIGASGYATTIAAFFAQRGRKVTLHTGDVEAEHDDILILPYAKGEHSDLTRTSLIGAERIIVSHASDTHTATDAVRIAIEHPDTPVFAAINDPWLAKHTRFAIEGKRTDGDFLIPIAWPAAAARSVLAKYPPFLLSKERKKERLHLVIVGFDSLGQALIEDVLNSSLVAEVDNPRFTIIDPEVDQRFAGFMSRHAGLKGPQDSNGQYIESRRPIKFDLVSADFAVLEQEAELAILSLCREEPVTAFYVCDIGAPKKLERALALRDLMRRNGICESPIFLYAPDSMGLRPIKRGTEIEGGEVIVFGDVFGMIEASGIADIDPDSAARSYHAIYQGLELDREASAAWKHLSEDFRRSNRRAVSHVLAKLYSLDIELRSFLAASDTKPGTLPGLDREAMTRIQKSLRSAKPLPELEHRRWMMDKWMDGWSYGQDRDDLRKQRPDLKPYDALSPETQAIDKAFAQWLLSNLRVHD